MDIFTSFLLQPFLHLLHLWHNKIRIGVRAHLKIKDSVLLKKKPLLSIIKKTPTTFFLLKLLVYHGITSQVEATRSQTSATASQNFQSSGRRKIKLSEIRNAYPWWIPCVQLIINHFKEAVPVEITK